MIKITIPIRQFKTNNPNGSKADAIIPEKLVFFEFRLNKEHTADVKIALL
jgi:hypothetical protein